MARAGRPLRDTDYPWERPRIPSTEFHVRVPLAVQIDAWIAVLLTKRIEFRNCLIKAEFITIVDCGCIVRAA